MCSNIDWPDASKHEHLYTSETVRRQRSKQTIPNCAFHPLKHIYHHNKSRSCQYRIVLYIHRNNNHKSRNCQYRIVLSMHWDRIIKISACMKVGLMPRVHAYTLASPPPSPGWGTWGPHVSQRTSCAHRHSAPVPTLASLFLLALFPTRLPRESRSLRVRERRRGSHNWINRPGLPPLPTDSKRPAGNACKWSHTRSSARAERYQTAIRTG